MGVHNHHAVRAEAVLESGQRFDLLGPRVLEAVAHHDVAEVDLMEMYVGGKRSGSVCVGVIAGSLWYG